MLLKNGAIGFKSRHGLARKAVALAVMTMALVFQQPALACPNCKNAQLEAGVEASRRMSAGYYASYVFLTSMPFVAVGCAAFVLLRSRRKEFSEGTCG